ncbi:MAG: type II toxin-antitoxin system PemK/MazF family toxin [bacterium]|nr:type II toxin-antitoxin system PemK/MazF family toxin [bacterium]MCP4966167.1 type II toxin-antitoxin system PemK/MazF family toxin [bacterium]
MRRGEIWWADLGRHRGSSPAKRRPVLVVQADSYNASRIGTVLVAVITSNMRLEAASGNVSLSRRTSKLTKQSVVNVSQVVTLGKDALTKQVSTLDQATMAEVDDGLRLSLSL